MLSEQIPDLSHLSMVYRKAKGGQIIGSIL